MMKYPVKGRIDTVPGEEEYMDSHLNSFIYVEMDDKFIETESEFRRGASDYGYN